MFTTVGKKDGKLYIEAIQFYPTTKKTEVMPFTGKWMELKSIVVSSKVTQAQKEKHCMRSLLCES